MKKVVLVGGCFDLLHKGHIAFLKKAKKLGKLIVLLESDEKIKKLKGEDRPVQDQITRAKALSDLGFVDKVISLPFLKSDKDYDELVQKIKPDIIVVTKGYPASHHQRAANLVGAKLKTVGKLGNYSTTGLLSKRMIK